MRVGRPSGVVDGLEWCGCDAQGLIGLGRAVDAVDIWEDGVEFVVLTRLMSCMSGKRKV